MQVLVNVDLTLLAIVQIHTLGHLHPLTVTVYNVEIYFSCAFRHMKTDWTHAAYQLASTASAVGHKLEPSSARSPPMQVGKRVRLSSTCVVLGGHREEMGASRGPSKALLDRLTDLRDSRRGEIQPSTAAAPHVICRP